MKRLTISDLPEAPLEASRMFHAEWLGKARTLLAGDDLLIALPHADHTHSEWRCAAAAMLARVGVPQRAFVVAGEGKMLDETERFLAGAPGITGQYLKLHSDEAA
ncbi:hypothetical protein E3U23_14100 [Erythrobacter litoralis]|uniref:Rossmann fold domain-containing protein n=1 Tax=Erythrobacter litoralis TaxID=39960 RepID=UPI002435C027|nr:hypothetical protein [Erythrobacter litoralis]MDG6080320.1 hypothetical protein [Erythrobacter litoralis]